MCTIIGRKQEIKELTRRYESGRAEFIAIYGRRRVGKTFLINEVLGDGMVFHHTGLSPYDRKRKVSLKSQLQNFQFSLIRHGLEGIAQPKSWMEAFFLLEQLLERLDNGSRQVVFIDELPWMDTARSGFLTALEAFWNGWGCSRHNLCLVVCGSATSWMLDNIINNKGGLYGRLTCEMKLSPFTLLECEQFFESRKIDLSRYNIIQAYMILGGIPFYLDCFNPSLSLAQNIDTLFFNPKAKLGDEFERLFNSVFDNATDCMKIIRCLSKRHAGYRRDVIARKTDINPNGDFTKMLKALIASDFVTRYVPWGTANNEEYYKLSDCFCWFWLHFKEGKAITERDYWMNHMQESEISSWRGIAFEEVCLQHIQQIKMALQIAGVTSRESSLVVSGDDDVDGMQIDLLIDRADDVVNVCEMKYSKSNYAITKSYAEKLQKRIDTLEQTQPDKKFHLTFVTVNPLERNRHTDMVKSAVTAEELFK
ncbi:MAG: ATP-binding protein [Prevotella sp.]|nr:ATP-binding protein [Prevotella sp.]